MPSRNFQQDHDNGGNVLALTTQYFAWLTSELSVEYLTSMTDTSETEKVIVPVAYSHGSSGLPIHLDQNW
jgi:hypothetical protein